MRAVLSKPWFWVNFAITLAATSWVPLLTLTPSWTVVNVPAEQSEVGANTMAVAPALNTPPADSIVTQGPDGAPITMKAKGRRVPVYECYLQVCRSRFGVYAAVAGLHLGLCFAISLLVWRSVLGGVPARKDPDTGEENP